MLAAVAGLLAFPVPAGAQVLPPQTSSQDSLAPRGAPPHWLPAKRWVTEHWLPYDETRLYRLLGVSRGGVWRWLRDDTRNLAGLAHARGWDPAVLAARLVEPWRGAVRDPRHLATLQRRALATLTQGHLSQHVFFHSLHQETIPDAAPALFGVASREQFAALRRAELSPTQICRLNGLPASHARERAEAILRATAREGVRRQLIPAAQAERLLGRQLAQLPRWLAQTRYNGPPPLANPRPSEATAANFSNNAAISADGTAVAWESYDAALATIKRKGEINVLARALSRGGPELASPRSGPAPAPRSSYNPAMSADGRFVAFESSEGNLNFGKRYGPIRVLVRDRRRGRTRAVATPGGGLTRTSYEPTISGDGRTVAFASYTASPLSDGAVELWVEHDGRLRRLRPGRGLRDLGTPDLSGDGRFLAFTATGPGRSAPRVYRADLRTGSTRPVSPGTSDEFEPDISADGRSVAYTQIVPGRGSRVLVTELEPGGASATRPAPARGLSRTASASEPSLSADGGVVAFTVRGALERRTSVWAADLRTRSTELVSRATAPAAGASSHPSVSADGRLVAFTSDAWNLSPAKCDAARGVFVRDRRLGTTRLLSVGDGANRYTGPTRGSSAPGDMTVELVCGGRGIQERSGAQDRGATALPDVGPR